MDIWLKLTFLDLKNSSLNQTIGKEYKWINMFYDLFSFVSVKVLSAPLNRILDDCNKFSTVTVFANFDVCVNIFCQIFWILMAVRNANQVHLCVLNLISNFHNLILYLIYVVLKPVSDSMIICQITFSKIQILRVSFSICYFILHKNNKIKLRVENENTGTTNCPAKVWTEGNVLLGITWAR